MILCLFLFLDYLPPCYSSPSSFQVHDSFMIHDHRELISQTGMNRFRWQRPLTRTTSLVHRDRPAPLSLQDPYPSYYGWKNTMELFPAIIIASATVWMRTRRTRRTKNKRFCMDRKSVDRDCGSLIAGKQLQGNNYGATK